MVFESDFIITDLCGEFDEIIIGEHVKRQVLSRNEWPVFSWEKANLDNWCRYNATGKIELMKCNKIILDEKNKYLTLKNGILSDKDGLFLIVCGEGKVCDVDTNKLSFKWLFTLADMLNYFINNN